MNYSKENDFKAPAIYKLVVSCWFLVVGFFIVNA